MMRHDRMSHCQQAVVGGRGPPHDEDCAVADYRRAGVAAVGVGEEDVRVFFLGIYM
jgi:hypothetical protein